jgi:hypothetical protein
MAPANYELPQKLVSLLTTIGPLHEEATDKYYYSVKVIVQPDDKSVLGFLITRQLIDKTLEVREGQGMQFRVPIKPPKDGEATYIFTDTLESSLDYIKQHGKQTA